MRRIDNLNKNNDTIEDPLVHQKALQETGYWGAKAAGALFYAKNTQRFLLGLRSPQVEQPNTLGSFGGAIDGDETPQKAVLRELIEETGFAPKSLLSLYIYKDGQFEYHNFVALVEEEFKPRLNWENQGWYWLSFTEIEQQTNLHFGIRSILADSCARQILFDLTRNGIN